jgi:adenylate cyclase
MKKLVTFNLALLISFFCHSQVNLDSLMGIWSNPEQSDSIRTDAYYAYIWNGFLFSRPDSAFILAEDLCKFGKENSYSTAEIGGYTLQGISFALRSDYPTALEFLEQCLEIGVEANDEQQVGGILSH